MGVQEKAVGPPLTPTDLAQFTAVDTWYRHWLNRMIYSDGVKYFAEKAGAYWFLDIVATEFIPLQRQEEFLNIVMEVQSEKARITVDDGNGNVVYTREVDYTDCPPGVWHFYLVDQSLFLPSQY